MKNFLLLIILFLQFISCQNTKEIEYDDRLFGTWVLPIIDMETKEILDTITAAFTKDGIVEYSSNGSYTYKDGTSQNYHIWKEKYYLTDQGTIITKGEDLNEVEAKYKFISEDTLQLDYAGIKQILIKIK